MILFLEIQLFQRVFILSLKNTPFQAQRFVVVLPGCAFFFDSAKFHDLDKACARKLCSYYKLID